MKTLIGVKVRDALAQSCKLLLGNKTIPTPELDCLILLSYITGLPKDFIAINQNYEIAKVIFNKYMRLIIRRLHNEPIAYITGRKEFYGINFLVSKGCLIPRPDTEVLVKASIEIIDKSSADRCFLEIGLGSGAVAISILRSTQQSTAVGLEISKKAIKVCEENAKALEVEDRLEILQSDMFSAIIKREDLQKKFCAIISNPPYIPSREIFTLSPDIRKYEPSTALDGGQYGTRYYKEIARNAGHFLKDDGHILVEIGKDQENMVQVQFEIFKWYLAGVKNDISKTKRVLIFKARKSK